MTNENILIITNSEENLLLYEAILSQEGFNVFKAENGNIGLQVALEKKPDLILMDQWEFDANGHEVLKKLKEQQISTRVIICPVAYDSTSLVIEFTRAGVCDYLRIPVGVRELVSAVRKALALDSTLISDPTPIVEKLLTRMENLEQKSGKSGYTGSN